MEMIYCPECGKKTPFRDEFAGKNLKCSCGQTFQAPSKKVISNQNPEIPPSSIKNPANPPKPPSVPANNHGSFDPQLEKLIAIALKDGIITDKERQILIKKAVEFGIDVDEFEMELDSRIPTKGADKPLMNIGNDNIVKANIKGGGNSGSGSGMPLMNIGNDNVIKAEIDASTNITHDNSLNVTNNSSLNVKGTYVAQQTIIHESGGSALMKFLTSSNLNNSNDVKNIMDQIDALPNDVPQLLKILSELCRYITREIDKLYSGRKQMSGNLKSVFSMVKNFINDPIQEQIGFAQHILDKIHKVAFNLQDQKLTDAVSKLDEIVFGFPDHYKKSKNKEKIEKLVNIYSGAVYIPPVFLFFGSFAALADGAAIPFLFLAVLFIGSGYGAYIGRPKIINYFSEKNKINQKELLLNDKYLNELLSSLKL